MELTEEYIERLRKKNNSAISNARLMYALWIKYKDTQKQLAEIIRARAERMENCLHYWKWDKYTKNKVMNLRVVSRC
ncbi:unnamed protein product, partial [marine sediment metagenome]